MDTWNAHSGLEIIPRPDCLRLLASRAVGRLAFMVGDQPLVLPVNYALQGDVVVFRTGEGTKLDQALRAKVAFEVDDLDEPTRSGWSVVVQGVAHEITDDDAWHLTSMRTPDISTWIPAPTEHWVRIEPTLISGRRLPVPSAR